MQRFAAAKQLTPTSKQLTASCTTADCQLQNSWLPAAKQLTASCKTADYQLQNS
jgi:hypothetical protein